MTIDLARIKETAASRKPGDLFVAPATILQLVAVVEAALRMRAAADVVLVSDAFQDGFEFHEADKVFRASLHPFTNGGDTNG